MEQILSLWSFLIISLLLTSISGIDAADEEVNIDRHCRTDLPSCFPTQLDWAVLESNMTGNLVFPEHSNYTQYNFQFNKRTVTFPIVHAMVHNADDIRAAIKFARDYNLRVTIKSSGHDFWGRSSAHSSFSINLMEMKEMLITTNRTDRSEHGELKVETGATWREIYQKVHQHNRVIVGLGAPSVASGGYTLGGGHSPLSSSLGLAVDNLLETQVVLADGRISTCTEHQTIHLYPDGTKVTENNGALFWALRGGGGGTFGVVVYNVFKLHPAPESLVKFVMLMPFYHRSEDRNVASELFNKYDSWAARAPPHWSGYVTSNNYNTVGEMVGLSGNLTGTISLFLIKLGPWDDNTMSELQEFFDLKDELPSGFMFVLLTNESSFWDIAQVFTDTWDPFADRSYGMSTLVPLENHNTSFSSFLWQEYRNDDNVPVSCVFTRLGGKVAEPSVNSTSLHPGWRSAQTCVSCLVGVYEDPDNSLNTFKEQERLRAKAIAFAAKLRTFGYGEYINEGDSYNPNWKLDYWREHYPYLLRLKVTYDPDNFFSCHHCVGSDYGSFRDAFGISGSDTVTRTNVYTFLLSVILVLIFP